ncbi:MAG: DUF4340 domain-containing protein [Alphaproteobacteria bacterium]|nr:DUF4340 domain-containing protein [Alphaproteobacteria bacterium]
MTILAAVLVVLVLIIRFAEPSDPEDEGGPQDLVEVTADAVVALTLVNQDGTLTADRTAEGWVITAPDPARGDDDTLNGLVDLVDRLKADPALEGADPAKYGLDTPRAVLTLRLDDGVEHRLELGAKAPVGYKTYVQFNGGGVQVASGDPGDELTRPLGTFRDRTVIRLDEAVVTGLAWDEAEAGWAVQRRGEAWWLADGRRADARVVARLQQTLRTLTFEGFWEHLTPEEAGLAPPRATMTITDELGAQTLAFGGLRGGGVLARSPDGVVGSVDNYDELLATIGELLERRLVPLPLVDVDRVSLELDGRKASWQRISGAWQRDGAPEADAGAALVDALTALEADRAARPEPPATVGGRLEVGAGEQSVVVTLGAPIEGGRPAQEEAGGPTFLVPAASVTLLEELLLPSS